MIYLKKRNELLESEFADNEEVLVNAKYLQRELIEKDMMADELRACKKNISRLSMALERAREQLISHCLSSPSYKRFEVRT